MAFYSIEPFGEKRADLRAAMIACTVANAAGGRGKGKPAFTVGDFCLKFEPKKQQSISDMKMILRSVSR